MDSKTEKLIIEEYKKGKSSLEITKIVDYSKATILKILHKHNLIRKRDRCHNLNYEYDGKYYILYRTCPTCNNQIPTKSKDKTITCRNHFKKINGNIDCKECSLLKQHGEGNPFYGKKHTKKTKNKISKSRKGKATGKDNSMANPEYRLRATENRLKKIKNNTIKHYNRSKAEKEIFKQIKKIYPNSKHSVVIGNFICDIYIPELNLILEYNGDYWHCNPEVYKKNYHHKIKSKTAEEIWEDDKIKVDFIKSKNYNIEILWEKTYKSNPKIIKNLLLEYE